MNRLTLNRQFQFCVKPKFLEKTIKEVIRQIRIELRIVIKAFMQSLHSLFIVSVLTTPVSFHIANRVNLFFWLITH